MRSRELQSPQLQGHWGCKIVPRGSMALQHCSNSNICPIWAIPDAVPVSLNPAFMIIILRLQSEMLSRDMLYLYQVEYVILFYIADFLLTLSNNHCIFHTEEILSFFPSNYHYSVSARTTKPCLAFMFSISFLHFYRHLFEFFAVSTCLNRINF